MKILTCFTIAAALGTIALLAPVQAQTPASSPTAIESQVNQELDEAARMFRQGNYVEAQAHSERALLIDPQNKKAAMYVARTIHAQFKPGNLTPENVAKAREAIVAYQRVFDSTPGQEEVYKAVAYLYNAIKDDERFRAWILQRAGDVSASNEKRAEAFVVLASRDWDSSFAITELPSNKITTIKGDKAYVTYRLPKERTVFERAQEYANRALEMVNIAIMLAPENESAWSYKANILLELEKLAEMSGQPQQKRDLHRQYEEALAETTRLSKRSQSNP